MVNPSFRITGEPKAVHRELFLYFADPEMKNPLHIIEIPEGVYIGQTAKLTVYALNITNAELTNIVFTPEDPDLKVIVSNKICKPKQIIMLQFVFTPSEDREHPLNSKMNVSAVGHHRHQGKE